MDDKKLVMARKIFESGFNCCQAVFTPFATEMGLTETASLKLASGFGAGMSYNGETCGAVVGAHMVIGLMNGHDNPFDTESKERSKSLLKNFRDKFTNEFGSCQCCDLLGANPGVDDEYRFLKENDVFKQKCPHFVDSSVKLLIELLK